MFITRVTSTDAAMEEEMVRNGANFAKISTDVPEISDVERDKAILSFVYDLAPSTSQSGDVNDYLLSLNSNAGSLMSKHCTTKCFFFQILPNLYLITPFSMWIFWSRWPSLLWVRTQAATWIFFGFSKQYAVCFIIIFRPTFSMGRKIIICVAFFFQILPKLHFVQLHSTHSVSLFSIHTEMGIISKVKKGLRSKGNKIYNFRTGIRSKGNKIWNHILDLIIYVLFPSQSSYGSSDEGEKGGKYPGA